MSIVFSRIGAGETDGVECLHLANDEGGGRGRCVNEWSGGGGGGGVAVISGTDGGSDEDSGAGAAAVGDAMAIMREVSAGWGVDGVDGDGATAAATTGSAALDIESGDGRPGVKAAAVYAPVSGAAAGDNGGGAAAI
jgi:hypothetical protein